MSTLNVNNINEVGGVDAIVSGGVLDSGSLPAGSILSFNFAQNLDSSFTTSSTSSVLITGMSVAVTPVSSSSKFFIQCFANFSQHDTADSNTALQIYSGGVASGTLLAQSAFEPTDGGDKISQFVFGVDEPATASEITFEFAAKVFSGNMVISDFGITVMEVAG